MLVTIGYGNFVESEKIIAILKPGSAPLRKLKEVKKNSELLVDATAGKPTRSFILMDNGFLIMSAISSSTLSERFNKSIED